jgi:tetratricopeptide (TPR) repeat protein
MGDRKRRFVYLAAAALALLAGGAAACSFAVRHHLDAAELALARREFGEALGHARAALRLWPWQARAHLLAARAARGEGRLGEAEEHLDEAERRGAEAEEITLEGYLLELRRGNLGPGVERMLRHRVESDHPRAGEILEALGQAYLHGYRLGEALDCAERWLAREPDSSHALYFRGLVREGLQGMSEAGDDYRRAVEIDPGNRRARLRLAEWCLARNQPREAAEHFERLRDGSGGLQARLGLARAYLQLAEYDRAEALLDELLAAEQAPPLVVLERARLAQARRRPEEAERFYRQAMERDPSSAEACRALAALLKRRGQEAEGQRFLKQADEIEAALARLHALLERLGKDPNDVAARYEAAMICLSHGQKQEARRWLLSVLRLRPDHRASREALARCQ